MGENRLKGRVMLNIHLEIIIKPEGVVNVYGNIQPRIIITILVFY